MLVGHLQIRRCLDDNNLTSYSLFYGSSTDLMTISIPTLKTAFKFMNPLLLRH